VAAAAMRNERAMCFMVGDMKHNPQV
jgi:hypothetical protein